MIVCAVPGMAADQVIRNINIMSNLNPLLPFTFTYNYRVPTEWQAEIVIGTTLNPSQLTNAFETAATNTFITSGEVGLKFGLPGDFILFVGWPWLGGLFSVEESVWIPEFDVSVLIPITLGVFSGSGYSESFSLNTVIKKSLPPVTICGGFNFLASPQFTEPETSEEVTEVAQSYLGIGLEFAINPFIRLVGEYRYQFSSVYFDAENNMKYEMFPYFANQIAGIGFEYAIDFPNFSLKATAGYSINLGIFDEQAGITYGTQGISLGFSFLFPFPWVT
jgi:hypothetical protein